MSEKHLTPTTTEGENVRAVDRIAAEKAGVKYAVGLSCCTAALHLCVKAAGEELYGKPSIGKGAIEGRRVMTVLEGEIIGLEGLAADALVLNGVFP